MRRSWVGLAIVGLLSSTVPRSASAGYVLADLTEDEILESVDPDAPVDLGPAADLLLVAVLQERIAIGALALTTRVPVAEVAGDQGLHLGGRGALEIGELLQLLLLTNSRAAAKSLASAVGPGLDHALARMRRTASRLDLHGTMVPDDWLRAAPARSSTVPAGRSGTTSPRDLARLSVAVARDDEMRRRLTLDGVPIADGGLIVRATSPLIAVGPAPASRPSAGPHDGSKPAVAIDAREGLSLLAVATGASAAADARHALERGFTRYQRVSVVRGRQSVGHDIKVRGGIIARFKAIAGEPLTVTTRRGAPARLGLRLQLPRAVDAPVEVDQPLGELVVERDGRLYAVIPLLAPLSIAPSRWLDTARE